MADRDPPAYLDYNATAPLLPQVKAVVTAHLDTYGNPSSIHGIGRQARAAVEQSRDAVAAMVNAKPAQVIFTSGGTEANALALRGQPSAVIFASAVEHPSVLAHAPAENLIPVDGAGVIDLAALEACLARAPSPALIAVMLTNNETGAVQPIARVTEIARRYNARVHCDAVQAPGKIAVDLESLGVDSVSLSAHKLGGLKGAGALVLKPGLDVTALHVGGGQERRRRAGTENVLGIVAFGVAAQEERGLRTEVARVRELRDALEADIRRAAPRAQIFSQTVERLPNTTCVSLPGMSSEIQVMRLDLAGVGVSAGSACSSGKVAPSHVLLAMGVPESKAKCAIRVSLGWGTTAAETARFLEVWRTLASDAAA